MSHGGVWVFLSALTLLAPLARAQSAGPRPLPDNPAPQFPTAAISDAVIGCVDLSLTVKPDGKPGAVRIVKAAPAGFGFEKAVRDAVARWRFEPPAGSGAAATFTNKYAFNPGPVPIGFWQRAPGARVSLVSGQTVQMERAGSARLGGFRTSCSMSSFGCWRSGPPPGFWFTRSRLARAIDRVAYRVNLANDVNAPAVLGRIDGGTLTFREVSFDQSAAAAAVRPAGEWQAVRVEVTNGAARVTANGVPISMSDEFVRRTGHIGLEVTRRSNRGQACHSRAARYISRLFGSRSGRRKRTISTDNQPARAHRGQAGLFRGSDEGTQRGYGDDGGSGAAGRIGRRHQGHKVSGPGPRPGRCGGDASVAVLSGIKDGEPVPVQIVIESSFSLR